MPADTALDTPAAADADDPAGRALHALLDAAQAHAPEYDHGLADHLPMALQALHALGAPADRLRAYATMYATRLEPAPPPAAPLPRWADGLGRREAWPALRAGFARSIARDGTTATLADALPVLMPGVAAGAFHGLLRSAHALQAGHDGELAAGLAYWAAAWQPLLPPDGGGAPAPRRLPLDAWVAAVLALPRPDDPDLERPRIVERMRAWAHSPGFAAVAGALAVDPARPAATLAALARLAAQVYAATANFTVLHVVTSCRAMQVLAPWQPAPLQAVRDYAVAVAAGLRAARLTAADLAAAPPAQALPWPMITAAAVASDDDHLAKLVHACRALHDGSDDADERAAFQRAASRAVRAAATRP